MKLRCILKGLKVSVTKTEVETVVQVGGSLDGRATLPDLGFVPGRLVISLSQLAFINSLGIRHWVNWIKTLRTEKEIVLTHCAPPFVRQLSILHTFIPDGARVDSICVPYYCDQCCNEEQKLIQVETELGTLPSVIPCVNCNGEAKLDVVKSLYFKFWEKKVG